MKKLLFILLSWVVISDLQCLADTLSVGITSAGYTSDVSCVSKQKHLRAKATQDKDLSIIGENDTVTNIRIGSLQTLKGQMSLKEHGIQLTLKMSQLSNNQEYLNLCSNSKEVNKIIADISQCKYDIPEKVFCVSHLQSSLKISDNSDSIIIERMVRSIPVQLSALNGSASLAATSLLVYEDAFFYEMNLKEPVLYLYLYERGWQSMVIFRPMRDGIVLVNSYFVYHRILNDIENSDDVKSFFSEVLKINKVYVQECK